MSTQEYFDWLEQEAEEQRREERRVLDEKVFCISNGVVFDWMGIKDFHPTRPKKRSDPLTDAFMNLER